MCGVSVYFGWVRVGYQKCSSNSKWDLLSPTLTRPFPLDSVVEFLFYLLGTDKCQYLKQYIISLDWLRYCSRSLLLLKSDVAH